MREPGPRLSASLSPRTPRAPGSCTHRREGVLSRPSRRWTFALIAGVIGSLLPVGAPAAHAASQAVFDFPCHSGSTAHGDFNADGFPDLAVGAPGDNLEQIEVDGSITRGWNDAGSLNVIYSQADRSGLAPNYRVSPRTRRYFSQNTPGINETADASDNFGFVLASGNFDGLGGDDLAVGVPGENNGRGAVQVLYSGQLNPQTSSAFDTDGLAVGTPGTQTFNQFITQNTAGVDGTSEDGDRFGYAVAAGNLNNDPFADLVVGVPGEDLGSIKDAGVVQVIYGSQLGLTPNGPGASPAGALADQVFQQGPGQIVRPEIGRAEPGDHFGASLAIGQFNDATPQDVAVGAPGEDVRLVPDGGAVRILYSLPGAPSSGLSLAESDFFSQQTKDVNGISETADRMACALAGGDFDGDGDDDLAVGAPGEAVGADRNAGVVQILYNTGTLTGISVVPNVSHAGLWIEDQLWDEDQGGIPGVSKPDDRMGASLVAANFNSDGAEDLAVGLPTELLYTNNRSGSVRVMYGFQGVRTDRRTWIRWGAGRRPAPRGLRAVAVGCPIGVSALRDPQRPRRTRPAARPTQRTMQRPERDPGYERLLAAAHGRGGR